MSILTLQLFIYPLAYCLLVLFVWASVKEPRPRRTVLFLLACLPVYVVFQVVTDTRAEKEISERFYTECQTIGRGQVKEPLRDVAGLAMRQPDYKGTSEKATAEGVGYLSFSAWRDVFLSRLNGYEFLEEIYPKNVQVHFLEESKRAFREENASTADVEVRWEAVPKQYEKGIEALQLVLVKRSTSDVIGTQTILIRKIPPIRVPGFPMYTNETVLSCPMQVEVIDFIKSAALPVQYSH